MERWEGDGVTRDRKQLKLMSEVETAVWKSKSEQQFTHHLFCTDYNWDSLIKLEMKR